MLLLNDSLVARFTLQKRALLFSWCTVLVLFVFQPFGTYESELSYKYLRLAGYGFVTFFAVFVAGMIEIELSKYRQKIRYYYQLIIGLYVIIIALFNHSYFVVAIFDQWHWQNQMMFIFYVIALAIFPVTILYLSERRSTKLIDNNDSTESKSIIANPEVSITNKNFETFEVQIIGENKTDILTLLLTDIILIKSADNYCEIVTKKENVVSVNLLRISLSKVLAQLPENKLIVRCHRSYGVNLSLVKTSRGNANGLKLEMQLGDITVPVSRVYVDVVKQALSLTPKQSQLPQKSAVHH